jgi:hypothetical protein
MQISKLQTSEIKIAQHDKVSNNIMVKNLIYTTMHKKIIPTESKECPAEKLKKKLHKNIHIQETRSRVGKSRFQCIVK